MLLFIPFIVTQINLEGLIRLLEESEWGGGGRQEEENG